MENILKRLDFVIYTSEDITKHFDKTELDEITMFCMCMLDRLNFASEGLRILLNHFLSNTKVDYSLGIIIRSVLLDYLIVLNAMELYEKNLDNTQKLHYDLKEFSLMMLCDSVRNTMEYFETLENQIPKNIMSNMYKNLVSMNPNCFKSYNYDGNKPVIKTKAYKSPQKMFNSLVTSKDLKSYKSIYDAYLFYSKYDHFGNMFYGLSRVIPLDKLANLDKAITAFPRSLMFITIILETLYWSSKFLKTKREEITTFIDKIENIK
ncbi:MAG: hypothetical protein ABJB05_15145 [Parafilimonas sp.]